MTFQESIKTCLTKYAEFSGRATRSEYWWFALFNFLVQAVLTAISTAEALVSLAGLALLLPSLAAGARRLRDAGFSPWWLLLFLVPIVGWIALIIMFVRPSAHPYGTFVEDRQHTPNNTDGLGGSQEQAPADGRETKSPQQLTSGASEDEPQTVKRIGR